MGHPVHCLAGDLNVDTTIGRRCCTLLPNMRLKLAGTHK